MEPKPEQETGAVPIVFCDRLNRWLPIEDHMECDYCVAEVFDENGDGVSFICTRRGETRAVQPDYRRECEAGRGAPSDPEATR